MAVGIAISLIFQWVSLVRPTNRERDDWRNTVAIAALCLTALLAIWFTWNLIDAIAAGKAGQSGEQPAHVEFHQPVIRFWS